MTKSDEPGLREHAALTMNLFMCISRPWRLLCTRSGRHGPGWREICSVNALWGLGLLFVWAALGRSPLLRAGFWVAVVNQLWHLARQRRDGIPSYYVGRSVFAGVLGRRARGFEAILALGVAVALIGTDGPAAWYCSLVGIGHLVTIRFETARQEHQDQDVIDSLYEGAGRADRIQSRLGRW